MFVRENPLWLSRTLSLWIPLTENVKGYKTVLRPHRSVAAIAVFVVDLLAGSNCASGASVSTGAAVQAGVGIDRIDVAFLDCIGGAY
jgi:hypothetical protein